MRDYGRQRGGFNRLLTPGPLGRRIAVAPRFASPMLYPNRLQACLLFDRPVCELEPVMRDFLRIEGMRSGAQFSASDVQPGVFYRLYSGAEDLMVTLEYCDRPANPELFRPALSSRFTGLLTPDIRERIARSASHVILEVSHGVTGGVEDQPDIAAMFASIGRERSGATQAQFERRLQVLALIARIAIEHAVPLAVHWTQSDLLLAAELFDEFAAAGDMPGPLHIHPCLFAPRPAAADEALIGLRTFGARHWLGREILIEPNVLPWAANYETILAFMRVANAPNGYVIPDGDTFGPEDRSLSYRVIHHDKGAMVGSVDPQPADMALYELVPMKHLVHGFVAPGHVPEANVIDDLAPPPALLPADEGEKAALAREWADKRKLAEGIGGRFEVRHRDAAPAPPPPPPEGPAPANPPPGTAGFSRPGMRGRVFGRKGL